jgi:hypothetical protein
MRRRIDCYRCGQCDLSTIVLSFTVVAALDRDGIAHLRPAVREPLHRFLARALAVEADASPPASVFEPELEAIYAEMLDG